MGPDVGRSSGVAGLNCRWSLLGATMLASPLRARGLRYPEESKSGRAIGVALNEMAESVLRRQIGRHHNGVFVHTESVKRKENYSADIRIPVEYNVPASIINIRYILSYLAKEAQKEKVYWYFCNEIPLPHPAGRPRQPVAALS